MQTSLERRERRRRNGNSARRRSGSAAGRGIAIALPLFLMFTLVATGVVAFVGVVSAYSYYGRGLEDPKQLLDSISFNQQTVLTDRNGVELTRFGDEARQVLTFDQIPNAVLDATTSVEDKTFWTNTGFDPAGAIAAVLDGLAGRPRGASTITQQLVRARLLPVTASTADRKVKEIIQSIKLTEEYPGLSGKEKIITAYLNVNFFGNQSYGIASAANRYFGVKDLSKLTIAQAAILAAILKAPSQFDLVANATEQPDGTLVVPADSQIVARRNWALGQIQENNRAGLLLGKYDDAALEAAKSEPVVLHPPTMAEAKAPQFDLQVRDELASLLCGPGIDADACEAVDTGGYLVRTTLDYKMQASAEKWLKAYILGPNQGSVQADIDYLAKLGITKKSDYFNYSRIIGPNLLFGWNNQGLRDRNMHNGALIAIDYRTGQVMAYAGSAGFYEKAVKNPSKPGQNLFDPQFDVLSRGWRQPGSSFKPINYVVGIDDKKMTAATLFMDVTTDFGNYIPHDADGYQRGPLRMRTAIQQSLNIPALKAAAINGVDHLKKRAEDFGLVFPENANPGVSIGIGTVEVHPADLASAYGTIANGGSLQKRTTILSVTDSKGNVIWAAGSGKQAGKRVVSPQAAYVMTSILASNTDKTQNPWWGQYEIKSGNTRRPAALKTGTSDQTEDLFAGGYVAPPKDPNAPAIAAIVWAGNSDRTAGSGTMSLELAAPIWRNFIVDATAGTPVADFAQPNGITTRAIDGNSGMLPGPFTKFTYNEVFISGTEPARVDTTKIPFDVDKASGKLWMEGCTGPKETQGFLDLSGVEAWNPTWQKYDQAWIERAKKKQAATIYSSGWGAPFALDRNNPDNFCTPAAPSPSPEPSGSPGPSESPAPSPSGT